VNYCLYGVAKRLTY